MDTNTATVDQTTLPLPLVLTTVCSCGHNGRKGAHKKACHRNLVRGFTVANDLVYGVLPDAEVGPELPSDFKRVSDAMREGWGSSLSKTLTTGLMRQGMGLQAAVAMAMTAIKSKWILPAGGGAWTLGSES